MSYKALSRDKWRKPQSSDGYSPDEVVPIMGAEHFSSKKIRRLIRGKELKARKVFKKWRILPEDLEIFVANVEKENQ